MPARVVELCGLVTDFLDGETYSQAIVAERRNVPVLQTESSADILVTVFPGEYRTADETREVGLLRELTVKVAIQQIIAEEDERTAQDAMLLLVDEIEDSLIGVNMGEYCYSTMNGISGIRETMFADQTVNVGLFMAILEVIYIREV